MNIQGLLGGIGQALSNPKFRLLWWTNTVNSTGRWQYKFAVSWYTWETTKSPALLGIVAFADTVPLVFMTVIAGAWTDRHSTMLIMRMCQSIMVAAGILISVFALTGSLNIIYIIVLSFVIGAAEAVTVPARLSVVHQLVPKEHLSSAIALGSASFNLARFIGPALAGIIIQVMGVPMTIVIATGMFLLFYFGLLALGPGEKVQNEGSLRSSILKDLVGGFSYVLSHAGITFLVFVLSLTALLIRPFIDLLAGVSDQVFGEDVAGFSILVGNSARCPFRRTMARAPWPDRGPHQSFYLVPNCLCRRSGSSRGIAYYLDRRGHGLLHRYVCCFRIDRVTGFDPEFSRAWSAGAGH